MVSWTLDLSCRMQATVSAALARICSFKSALSCASMLMAAPLPHPVRRVEDGNVACLGGCGFQGPSAAPARDADGLCVGQVAWQAGVEGHALLEVVHPDVV